MISTSTTVVFIDAARQLPANYQFSQLQASADNVSSYHCLARANACDWQKYSMHRAPRLISQPLMVSGLIFLKNDSVVPHSKTCSKHLNS